MADELRTDRSGSLIAFKKGRKRRAEKLLFSAHMDEVGFNVTHISEEGFAYFGTIGGIDPARDGRQTRPARRQTAAGA